METQYRLRADNAHEQMIYEWEVLYWTKKHLSEWVPFRQLNGLKAAGLRCVLQNTEQAPIQ
jgi:hypothetical protein